MSVASSNGSPDFFGAATNRRNSRDLLQRYFSPRHSISFRPLVDQLAMEVKTAAGQGTAIGFPEIGHDRLARRKPFQIRGSAPGNRFVPDIFAEGEERVMAAQIFDGRS